MVNLDTYQPRPRIVPLIWHSCMKQGLLQFSIKYTLSTWLFCKWRRQIKLKIDYWQYNTFLNTYLYMSDSVYYNVRILLNQNARISYTVFASGLTVPRINAHWQTRSCGLFLTPPHAEEKIPHCYVFYRHVIKICVGFFPLFSRNEPLLEVVSLVTQTQNPNRCCG
jgi:hypothetical protein